VVVGKPAAALSRFPAMSRARLFLCSAWSGAKSDGDAIATREQFNRFRSVFK
jgi:hypothetical protein